MYSEWQCDQSQVLRTKEALSTTCRYDLQRWGLLCEKCGHPHYRVIIKPKSLRQGGHQHLLMAVVAIKKGKQDDMTWATNWDGASGDEVTHQVAIIIWWEDHRIDFPNVRSRRVQSFWLLNAQHVRRHRVNHSFNINKVGVRSNKMEKIKNVPLPPLMPPFSIYHFRNTLIGLKTVFLDRKAPVFWSKKAYNQARPHPPKHNRKCLKLFPFFKSDCVALCCCCCCAVL